MRQSIYHIIFVKSNSIVKNFCCSSQALITCTKELTRRKRVLRDNIALNQIAFTLSQSDNNEKQLICLLFEMK